MNVSYTVDEIMQYTEENDVRFVRLAFCDIFGQLKNIAISVSALKRAFTEGVRFDASMIRGFLNVEDSDLLLFPDPNTMAVLPWRPSQGRVIRFYCSIRHPDSRVFQGDCRSILQNYEKTLFQKGYEMMLGSELEFYLFKLDDEGTPTRIPMDNAGYFDIAPLDKGENIRREICLTMEEMGLKFESSHHEKGPGQNEVVFRHSMLLDASDNVITFRSLVKSLAARNGLYASFLPKPLERESGSGFHMNFSIKANDRPFSEIRDYMMAGILKHISEITVFLNPTANSYDRLGEYEAPSTVDWGTGNRGLLLRVPAGDNYQDAERIEVRSPDSACNPYIATYLLSRAAMEGIEEKLSLSEWKTGERLPDSLIEAIEKAEESQFIKASLPEHLVNCFLQAKKQDWEEVRRAPIPKQRAIDMEFSVT